MQMFVCVFESPTRGFQYISTEYSLFFSLHSIQIRIKKAKQMTKCMNS